MKLKKFLSALLLTFLLIFSSCQKDDGNSGNGEPQENIPNIFSEYFGNEISKDFLGTVIDKNHIPIEGVTITIGNETAMTDSNGVFIIRDATVNERFGYIKAEKAGYINGSRSVVPSEGTNKVQIMLLEENVVGTVSSGSSGTVTADDGSSVSFDGNFVKEDGSVYSGSVDVIMHHLDPTDEAMTMQMPGMLYAQNEDGAERMLQTLGMLAIELRGSGGEDLNLPEGSTSEIKIPVDPSLMGMAPATIPLWYFDEANGYWKEEGTATLQGNMYVGTVSHFSFWNCDIPAEAITLCVTTTNENNNILNNLYATVTSATFGTRGGYTNDNGEVCGFVPSNENLILSIYGYDLCGGAPLYIETIGSFNTDSSIVVIVPDNPDTIIETVTGIFNTCDGEPVSDGYMQIAYGGQTFTDVVDNGEFEINLLRCAEYSTFSMLGFDFVNSQTTGSINYTFSTPITNIGDIIACNMLTEFVQYTIDGDESHILFENIQAKEWMSWIEISAQWQNYSVQLIGGPLEEPDPLGSYYDMLFDVYINGFPETISIGGSNGNVIYNLNAFGDVGEYIDINFSGPYEDSQGNPHFINGIVHVLRDE